jgi:Ala-tRNA(Pro) deacylase
MSIQQRTPAASGDVIEVGGRRVGEAPRVGEILEVLGSSERPHYRVRWDDGHESVFYPAGDTRIRHSARDPVPVAQLVQALRERGLEFELLPHRRTLTAAAEARALGVLPQETAKTVIAKADGRCVRAVVPASGRVDPAKLASVVGRTGGIDLLTEDELAPAYPEFELGAVPPFGGREGDLVVVDSTLAGCDYVVFDAGVHDTSLRLRAHDLIDVAGARVADIAAA